MHLSRLVPALGLLVTAANVQAVDLADGRLHVNGWLDFVASTSETSVKNDTTADMYAAGELGVTYDVIKDKATMVLEARYRDSEDTNEPNRMTVAQAYGVIKTCPKSSLTVGYFDNWLGLEAVDPIDMKRINHSIVWNTLTGVTVTGAKFAVNLMEGGGNRATVTAALVDDVFAPHSTVKGANDLASALIFDYEKTKDEGKTTVAKFQASFTNDWDAVIKSNGKTADLLAANMFGSLKVVDDSEIGVDSHYQYTDSDHAKVGLMGYVNQQLPTADVWFPMNLTAMVSYLDEDAKNTLSKAYKMEYALALNTTPFKDFDTLGVNLEVNAIDTVKADDKTVLGAAIEILFKF